MRCPGCPAALPLWQFAEMSIPFPATGLVPFPLSSGRCLWGWRGSQVPSILPDPSHPHHLHPIPTPSHPHPCPIPIPIPSSSHPHPDSLQPAGWRQPVHPEGGDTTPPSHPTFSSSQPRALMAPDASPCPIPSAGPRPAPSSCPGFGVALGLARLFEGWLGRRAALSPSANTSPGCSIRAGQGAPPP